MCYIRREVTWFKVIFQWNCSATQWVLSGLKQSWTEMHTTSKHLVGKKKLNYRDLEILVGITQWLPSQKVYLVKSVLNYNMSFKYRYCFELLLQYYYLYRKSTPTYIVFLGIHNSSCEIKTNSIEISRRQKPWRSLNT